MKRLLAIGILVAVSCSLHGQVVDATVCDVLKNPASFNGKTVRMKGTVFAGFDQFIMKGEGCGQKVNAVWLSYPEGTKGKAGPAASVQLQPAKNFSGTVTPVSRTAVTLDKNKDFKQFDSLLSTPAKVNGLCLGCVRYEVSATVTGRLDGAEPAIHRDGSGKITAISGFGNMNAYGARLVIQSIADVTPQEVDYSKGGGKAASGASSVVEEFGSSNLQGEAKRGIDAFGKEGDDNGVSVGFGGFNEYSAKSEGKDGANSPDGVIYDCRFDMDRLKGNLLSVAMAHIGEHVADLRNPGADIKAAGPYQLEFRGSITGMLSAMSLGQKSVVAPGGYVMWNAGWSNQDINTNTAAALAGFLANEAMLSK